LRIAFEETPARLNTSQELHGLIKRNFKESRREWLLAMMEKAGKENSNNCGFQL